MSVFRELYKRQRCTTTTGAVSTCSMREGIVLYNENKHPIWACGNVDARATTEVNELKALNNYTFEQQLTIVLGKL